VIKLKILPTVAGTITGDKFITVERSGRAWTLDVDYTQLSEIDATDSATSLIAFLDQETDTYKVASVDTLLNIAGVGDVFGPESSTDNAAARFDLATGKLIQDSPLVIADTTGALSRTGNGGIPLQGTNTNDSAAAGYLGEYTSSTVVTGSAISLTNDTPANITSISLTAGDWEVEGSAYYNIAGTTTPSVLIASISATSATLDTAPGSFQIIRLSGAAFGGASVYSINQPAIRISLSGTATIYLVAQATFGTSTLAAYGIIKARRVR
jgi:hypothetical protein